MRALLAITLFVFAAAIACNRGPDVQRMADGAIDSIALGDVVDVHYDDSAHLVRLSGTVKSGAERARAEEAVQKSVGSLAQIANEIVVEGLNEEIADDFDTAIGERLGTVVKSTPALEDEDVTYRVANGVVTLAGTVASADHRAEFEKLARGVPGVKDVVNTITVVPGQRR
ncbi:MAG: BON domain-containing protein [Vicinamibacterales bacterium]